MRKSILSVIIACLFLTFHCIPQTHAQADEELVMIKEENTFQHDTRDQEKIQPSKRVKELLEEAEVKIENPTLIKLLNESSWRTSPFAFGYHASISLGRWPLHYTSEESMIHPHFQAVNRNEKVNSQEDTSTSIFYQQLERKRINGALTEKVNQAEQIKEMMLQKALQQHEYPLAFQVTIGQDTKLSETYSIPASRKGILKAYIPAVKESGHITSGDITLKMKGSRTELVVKNVTEQEAGAFIPIADHLSFTFETE